MNSSRKRYSPLVHKALSPAPSIFYACCQRVGCQETFSCWISVRYSRSTLFTASLHIQRSKAIERTQRCPVNFSCAVVPCDEMLRSGNGWPQEGQSARSFSSTTTPLITSGFTPGKIWSLRGRKNSALLAFVCPARALWRKHTGSTLSTSSRIAIIRCILPQILILHAISRCHIDERLTEKHPHSMRWTTRQPELPPSKLSQFCSLGTVQTEAAYVRVPLQPWMRLYSGGKATSQQLHWYTECHVCYGAQSAVCKKRQNTE